MNAIRAIMHLSVRGYRIKRSSIRRSVGNSRREIEMVQPHMRLGRFDEENEDFEDVDEFESDFSNVGEYHKMHERELEVRKAKLKTQIVKRQYFKTEEPAMLTWGEKEQIRLLYKEDPEEWSPDKLCESFPASRETILKVLRSKWLPNSTKVIESYEKRVKNNWDLFKAGKLVINPELRAHLGKFKDREITITDPKMMEKFLRPKPVFPKPQSVLFTNIIQGYLNENNTKLEAEKMKTEKLRKESEKEIPSELSKYAKIKSQEKLQEIVTCDQFLKNHVESVRENEMTPVDRVIIDKYKAQNAEAYKSETLVLESQSAIAPSKELEKMIEKNLETREIEIEKIKKREIEKIKPEVPKKSEIRVIDESSFETGIIARHKKIDSSQDDYPEFIKIPTIRYKPGVTYRVEDRYYDDDGVFLYRVPGLKA